MNRHSSNWKNGQPRILLFSHGNIYEKLVWRCASREFQRIIEEIDAVEVIAPRANSWYRNGKRFALRLGEFVSVPVNPGVSEVTVDRDYDLFFTMCDGPSDLLH